MRSIRTIGAFCRLGAAGLCGVLVLICAPTSAVAQDGGGTTDPRPTSVQIEGVLHWESGRACRELIDACLDEHGNELFPLPEFSVSQLECAQLAEARFRCSFLAEERYATRVARRSRCTATLIRRDQSWYVESSIRPRRVELACP